MAAGILRRWIASMAVSLAFALGGTWVLVVFKIADATDRCLRLEGSVWADDACLHLMSYPSAVAAVSLLLMLWLWRREVKADDEAKAAVGRKDPEVGIDQDGPERRGLRESGSVAAGGIIVIYSFCVLVMFLGGMVRSAGERLLLKDSADTGAAAQVRTGIVIGDAGRYCRLSLGTASSSFPTCCSE